MHGWTPPAGGARASTPLQGASNWTTIVVMKLHPEEITAKFLSRIKEVAVSYLGTQVLSAVVAVPVCSDAARRRAAQTLVGSPARACCPSSMSRLQQLLPVVSAKLGLPGVYCLAYCAGWLLHPC